MSEGHSPVLPMPVKGGGRYAAPRGSPAEALSSAFHDTLRLLFRPFDARRWFKLGLICLFLGGGTPSAAFNWSLGSLRSDAGVQSAAETARQYASHHLWLVILATAFGLGFGLALLYLRAMLRFVLVEAILNRTVDFGRSWVEVQPLGNSYFLWLLGVVAGVVVVLASGVILAVRHFRAVISAAPAGAASLEFSITLVAVLAVVTLGALVMAIVITLTDDLVVPLMYAERLTLLAAWRKLGHALQAEAGAFTLYLLLRFGVSLLIGVMLLLLLFPTVLTLFSGALIAGALTVVTLGMVGLHWVWNPVTTVLAGLAVLLLTGVMLVLLSVVGMPGQVLLQDFGIRFAAFRFPALEAAWRSPALRLSD